MKEGWTYKTLGAVSFYPNERIRKENIQFNRYIGVENLVKNLGGINLSDELPDIDSAVKFEKGDILIGNIRPYLRKGWLSTFDGGASGDVIVVRIRKEYKEIIKDSFLYKILTSDKFFEFDNSHTKGAKMPRGDRNYISKFTIPIPPLVEQERIVAELDLLTEIIDKQKAQLKELDTLAQSIFYDMFGDPVENEKGWDVKKLSSITTKIGSGATPKGGNESYKSEGISLIRSLNVHNNEFLFKDLAYIDDEQANALNNVEIKKDDVLLNITGASVARCCIVPNGVLPARVNQHVCIIRTIADKALPIYINRLLTNEHYQMALLSLARSKAATREALPKSLVDNLPISLPPLSLQQSFADKINAIEQQKAAITQSIADTQKLFDYTMDKYFG